ncbi:PWWP domain-containing protein2, partial [Coniochaeta hoffmannii]
MRDTELASAPVEGEEDAQPEGAATTSAVKGTATKYESQRKLTSTGGDGQKHLQKGPMARITHVDYQPGDHCFVTTKDCTKWPAMILDDKMLPSQFVKIHPVTAKREETYAVIHLRTNELAWVRNTDLSELDPRTILDKLTPRMTKPCEAAYRLASENHSLDHYKELLWEQKAREKAQATPTKKSQKRRAKINDEGDVEMADADGKDGSKTAKKSKKRKADESAEVGDRLFGRYNIVGDTSALETPQRAESMKKPKIKLTTNGTASTPQEESKSAKKSNKITTKVEKEIAAPKTPEERYERKVKEVKFLRYKLQKEFLSKGQLPKEEEMESMSAYFDKLEAFPDLEVGIIEKTKIHKALKAILRLDFIPKDDEHKFKQRSQRLLDQWLKILAGDGNPSGEA